MKNHLAAGLVALTLISAPVSAATFVNVGEWATIDFNGIAGGTVISGLSARLVITFNGFSGNNALFSYTLDNTSTAPVTQSRVSSWGFNVDTANFNFANSTETSSVYTKRNSGQFPQPNNGGGRRDFCLSAGPNCGGGGGGGIFIADTAESAGFTLAFDTSKTQVALSKFVVRYQSLNAPDLQIKGGSAIGVPTAEVEVIPEPATWAMLIAGFGLVGATLRRRRGLASVHT